MTGLIRRLWYLALGALAVYAWQRARRPWTVRAVVEFPAALLPPGMTAIGVQVGVVGPDGGDGEPEGLDPGIWGGMG